MRVPSYGSEGALDICDEGGLFGRSPRSCPAGTAHEALLHRETSAVRKINMQQPRVGVPKYVTCCLLLQERLHFLFYFMDPVNYPCLNNPCLFFLWVWLHVNTSGVAVCCCLVPIGEALWGTTWLYVTMHHAKHYTVDELQKCDDMALFRSVHMKRGLDKQDNN